MDAEYVEYADMDPWEIATYPLSTKQHTTGVLHEGPAYSEQSLRERMTHALEESIANGTKRVDTFIDTTADCIGLTALETTLGIKEKYRDEIEFRIGAYPIFGFKDSEKKRWELFEEGAKMADYIGTLPERDNRKGHIGFKEHFRRVITLADRLGKSIQMHVDQTNNPEDTGTETLVEAVRWLRPDSRGHAEKREPTVWAVHALSIASFDEERFHKLTAGLKENNIGIIVCPGATISNKQNRKIQVPMHNSITRVLEFLLEDIPVRMGSDNIEDFFMPAGSPDMFWEVKTAADALRFYNFNTWAKIACGKKLNEVDKMKIRQALDN
jgi:cytosine/adenosine deaminase-related metal-dependent hydrolase